MSGHAASTVGREAANFIEEVRRQQRCAAGGALYGQTLDVLVPGAISESTAGGASLYRCRIMATRRVGGGATLLYLLHVIGDANTTLDVFGSGRHLGNAHSGPDRLAHHPRVMWASLTTAGGSVTATVHQEVSPAVSPAVSKALVPPLGPGRQQLAAPGAPSLLNYISSHARQRYVREHLDARPGMSGS
jgi:hypothetical protein